MPSTIHRIEASLAEAIEQGNEVRACTLRLMLAAVRDRELETCRGADATRVALEGQALRDLLQRMVRQRLEAIAEYEEAGHAEIAERERAEIEVIKSFLPKPMSRDEMQQAVARAIVETQACSIRDLGRVMGHLRSKYPGRIDFGEAGAEVKAALG
ncbi:MAG: GatB/YqeY domain-containing protein [Pseudomonadota bacterium]